MKQDIPGNLAAERTANKICKKRSLRMKASWISYVLTLGLGASAAASTFTVDNIFDPGNGICDSTGCTLHEAIEAANANPGADDIAFNIPGDGVHLIILTGDLPAITDPVIIDGYTQPGTSANTLATGDNAVLLIEIDGDGNLGLEIAADDCTVRGLVINRCLAFGILIQDFPNPVSNTVVEGNFIGTNAAGTAGLGNLSEGVFISHSSDNLIGGMTPAARNLISGNGKTGVLMEIGGDVFVGTGNSVQGNYIGTDLTGTSRLANGEDGVQISDDMMDNHIGGATPGAGNLISGNARHGVYINSLGGGGNTVEGNLIGTDAKGALALPNDGNGVFIESENDNLIGGTEAGAGNLISGNGGDGVLIDAPAAGNTVQGNFIGTDLTGTVVLGNFASGVEISDASSNAIGGSLDGARNIISGNSSGVLLAVGAAANLVQGNYIGTDVSGNVALGNSGSGILIIDSPNNLIGGVIPGAGNLISGNDFGVQISLAGATGNVLQGNLIGTDAAGTSALGNSASGILLFTDSTNTTVGGPAGAGNIIAFNESNAISVNPASSGNSIFGNSIFANEKLGINLGGGMEDANLVTANDFPDSDMGANNLQNYPVISGITVSGSDRTVEGELASNPNTDYVLDFYSNGEVDPSGYGEGETYLGFLDVHTNAEGRVEFSFPLDAAVIGQFITATATDPDGNTSEFSLASGAVPGPSQFLNISTRMRVQTGDNVLIGGLIITGNDPKEVILRAIGPSLGGAGVEGFLANPTLELHYPDGTVVTNNDWRDTQEGEVIATGIPPTDDLESAIVATLDPGAYTAIVRGVNDGTGIGLVEVYDLGQTTDSTLANTSTRGFVETGDNVMIGGIIIGPDSAAEGSVLIRAIGPSLTDLGVPNTLADPMLELHDGNGAVISSNNDWKSSQQAAIEGTGIPPINDKESAILATLASGNYTAIVLGVGGTTGVGLVEAYQIE
jgi:hypothetical protein